jgi:exodeoxyribonuclease VII large subunit
MNNRRPTTLETMFRGPEVLTVSEVTARIKSTIVRSFASVIVEGQISGLKDDPGSNWYFTIKDAETQLKVVFFRHDNRLLRSPLKNGMSVRIRGSITVYAPQGIYQLVAKTIEPVGIGELHRAYEELRQKLHAEGLFDERRKRQIPRLPRRIGIVTSREGAVLHDILHVLGRRNPHLSIVIAPTRVQGPSAAREIAAAIRLLNQHASQPGDAIDVLIVGRGGGSMEDLWAFNEEEVARAIAASEIPVISAVGHETDFTIADFVADLRAATPSVAAERVTAGMDELRQRVDELMQLLRRSMRHRLEKSGWRLRSLIESRGVRQIGSRISHLERSFRGLESRLMGALPDRVQGQRHRLQESRLALTRSDPRNLLKSIRARVAEGEGRATRAVEAKIRAVGIDFAGWVGKLDALSPLAVLSRGYLIARAEDGRLVARASEIFPGEKVSLRFADGFVKAVTTEVALVEPTNEGRGER